MKPHFWFVTEPVGRGEQKFYFDSKVRHERVFDLEFDPNSKKAICDHFELDMQICNGYEYNIATQEFKQRYFGSGISDRESAEAWARSVDYRIILGYYKRVYFTKSNSEKFYATLKFLEMYRTNYIVVHNPYPLDKSENYLVDFDEDQHDLFCVVKHYLFNIMPPKNALRFNVYGFDIFEILRYCDPNQRTSGVTGYWNKSQQGAIDDAVSHLMDYYDVISQFDLYACLREDIIKRYELENKYNSFYWAV